MREQDSWPVTRLSLLMKLRDSRNAAAWGGFIDIYGPLIYRYCRRRGAQDADAAEITQDVLVQVWKSISTFHYQPSRGRFRNWLGTVTRNRLIRKWRKASKEANQPIDQLELAARASASSWEAEAAPHLLLVALDRVKPCFETRTWRAFEMSWLDEQPVTVVAEKLGVTVDRIYVAKSRVLKRLQAVVRSLSDDLPVCE